MTEQTDAANNQQLHSPRGQPLGVTGPFVAGRQYAVTGWIGTIARTDHYCDRDTAARGAEQARRDLALLATRPDGRR